MGMTACYMKADEALLHTLKTLERDEIFEKIEEYDSAEDGSVSLDKMWDGLHCLLTGESAAKAQQGDLLSEAVLGTDAFHEEAEEFITYIEPKRLQEILRELEQLDMDRLRNSFSPQDFAEKEIYPDIWTREDKEELAEELMESLAGLMEYYKSAVEERKGMIVSIY